MYSRILVGPSHVCGGEGNGTPLQYSCLENPMDGGARKAAVYWVAEGRTRLSDFTFTFHCPALEKEMATHSSVLVWRISGTGEPAGLLSMGSHRVGHDWSDLAAAAYPWKSPAFGIDSWHHLTSSVFLWESYFTVQLCFLHLKITDSYDSWKWWG